MMKKKAASRIRLRSGYESRILMTQKQYPNE